MKRTMSVRVLTFLLAFVVLAGPIQVFAEAVDTAVQLGGQNETGSVDPVSPADGGEEIAPGEPENPGPGDPQPPEEPETPDPEQPGDSGDSEEEENNDDEEIDDSEENEGQDQGAGEGKEGEDKEPGEKPDPEQRRSVLVQWYEEREDETTLLGQRPYFQEEDELFAVVSLWDLDTLPEVWTSVRATFDGTEIELDDNALLVPFLEDAEPVLAFYLSTEMTMRADALPDYELLDTTVAVVYTEEGLRQVLSGGTGTVLTSGTTTTTVEQVATVYLGADIVLTKNGLSITPRSGELIIDGTVPDASGNRDKAAGHGWIYGLDPSDMADGTGQSVYRSNDAWFTLTQRKITGSEDSPSFSVSGNGASVTLRNMNIIGSGGYGPVQGNTASRVTQTYVGVNYYGPQMTYNTGSGSKTIYEDCNIVIDATPADDSFGGGTYSGEVAEASSVKMMGRVVINKFDNDGHLDEMFYLHTSEEGIVIAEGADVYAKYHTRGNGVNANGGGFAYIAGNNTVAGKGVISVMDNARFHYHGWGIFLDYARIASFSVGKYADVSINIESDTQNTATYAILAVDNLVVDRGGALRVELTGSISGNRTRPLLNTNNFEVDASAYVLLSNDLGPAVGYTARGPLNLKNIYRIRQWDTTGSQLAWNPTTGMLDGRDADYDFFEEDENGEHLSFSVHGDVRADGTVELSATTPMPGETGSNHFSFKDRQVLEILGRTHTLSYHANGAQGEAPPATTGFIGTPTTIEGQGAMTWHGKAFAGWNTDKEAADRGETEVKYTPGSPHAIEGDVLLYAVWVTDPDAEFTLTYHKGDDQVEGNPPAARTERYNTEIQLPGQGDMAWPGMLFQGWNSDPDKALEGEVEYAAGQAYRFFQNATLYAVWTPDRVNTYTVTYRSTEDTVGQVPADNSAYFYGEKAQVLPSDMYRVGYNFVGWVLAEEENSPTATVYSAGAELEMTGNRVLVARWMGANDITVTLVPNNGGANMVFTVPLNTSLATLMNTMNYTQPENAYHTFGGWWFVEGLGDIKWDESWNFTKDTTLSARWIPLAGTTQVNYIKLTEGQNGIVELSRESTTAGQYQKDQITLSDISDKFQNVVPEQNFVLDATATTAFAEGRYTFVAGDGTNPASVTFTVGTTPEVNLYYGLDKDDTGQPDYREHKVTATWYKVQVGQAPVAYHTETYTGIFGEKSTVAASDHLPISTDGEDWIYDTANSSSGSVGEALEFTYGKTGAVSFYWDIDADNTGVPDRDEPHTVVYHANAGNLDIGNPPVDSGVYHYGQTVTLLGQGDMNYPHRTFGGWNTQADGNGTTYQPGQSILLPKKDPATPVGQDAEFHLYAIWNPIAAQTTVNYYQMDEKGGVVWVDTETRGEHEGEILTLDDFADRYRSQTASENYILENDVTALEAARLGYSFTAQNDQPGQEQPATITFTVGENQLVNIYYALDQTGTGEPDYKEYTVTYKAGGAAGQVPEDPNRYEYGKDAIVLGKGNLNLDRFGFRGWSTSEHHQEGDPLYQAGDPIGVDGHITLYAVWEREQVLITLEPENGTVGEAQRFLLPVGSTLANLKASSSTGNTPYVEPVKDSSEFVGWFDTTGSQWADTKAFDADYTLYARYDAYRTITVHNYLVGADFDLTGGDFGTPHKTTNETVWEKDGQLVLQGFADIYRSNVPEENHILDLALTEAASREDGVPKYHFDTTSRTIAVDYDGTADQVSIIYALDKDGDGKPDYGAHTLTATWYRVDAHGNTEEIFAQTISGNYGTQGQLFGNQHPPVPEDDEGWIFDAIRSSTGTEDEVLVYTLGKTGDVAFYWDIDGDNTGVPDRDEPHRVVYHANAGNLNIGLPPVDGNIYRYGDMAVLLGQNDMNYPNRTFGGWNTQADGNGTTYQPGQPVPLPKKDPAIPVGQDAEFHLYAIWNPIPASTYVKYFLMDGKGEVTLDHTEQVGVHEGDKVTLAGFADKYHSETPSQNYILETPRTAEAAALWGFGYQPPAGALEESITFTVGVVKEVHIYYALDQSGTGIPDKDEGTVLVRWHTRGKVGGSYREQVAAYEQFYGPAGIQGEIDLDAAVMKYGLEAYHLDTGRSDNPAFTYPAAGETLELNLYYNRTEYQVEVRWVVSGSGSGNPSIIHREFLTGAEDEIYPTVLYAKDTPISGKFRVDDKKGPTSVRVVFGTTPEVVTFYIITDGGGDEWDGGNGGGGTPSNPGPDSAPSPEQPEQLEDPALEYLPDVALGLLPVTGGNPTRESRSSALVAFGLLFLCVAGTTVAKRLYGNKDR